MKPMNNMVVVEHETAKVTKGGLHLPDKHRDEQYVTGVVVAVGPGAATESGARVPIPLDPGDVVVFDKSAAFDIEVGNKRLYCVDALRILIHLDEESNGSQSEGDKTTTAAFTLP